MYYNNNMTERYDYILIDTLNLAYKTFVNKKELPEPVMNNKVIYKESVCNFIHAVDFLKDKFGHGSTEIYFLTDNFYTKDLQSCFMNGERKELSESYKKTRKKENKEFYRSVSFVLWYYMANPSNYYCVRVRGLEADDLVKPIIKLKGLSDKKCLMVTSDLDWCRYLSHNIHWLPKLGGEPEDSEYLRQKLGFQITENNVILYKAIFGDESDNIAQIVHKTEKNKSQLVELMDILEYPERIVLMARDTNMQKKYPILTSINENERQTIINIQLVSSINKDYTQVEKGIIQGNDEKKLYSVIRKAIGLDLSEEDFSFGQIRRPRA